MQELPQDQEALIDALAELVGKRLLQKATQTVKVSSDNPLPQPEGELKSLPAVVEEETVDLSRTEFTKVEKNLASLGFFTPSSKRIKDAKAKTVIISATVDGNRIEAKATIAPAALYGLPITADQDKFLALQKIITDLRQKQGGRVSNPISFTSAELLALLHKHRDSGKNYREIDEWLNVMASTTIISEGAVYLAGKKRWVKDRFHVFDRAVSFGKELESGVLADKNYIWLSEWQLENINNNHLIPVDLEVYRQLKNHIAKTLVPLLQIWLFASQKEGTFEKRYEELSQILSIREYHQISRIKEQLSPSLDELQQHGYLASWAIEQTTDQTGYKIIFRHGEKFHRDRRRRLLRKDSTSLPQAGEPVLEERFARRRPRQAHLDLRPEVDFTLMAELTKRGVGESGARKLLTKLPSDRPIIDLLEWGDEEIARQPGKIRNAAGFYIRLLEEHSAPPPTFESSRQRKARQEAEFAQQRVLQEQEEVRFRQEQAQRALAEARLNALNREQYEALHAKAKSELVAQHPWMAQYPDTAIHDGAIRAIMLRELNQPMDLLVVPQPQESGADAQPTASTSPTECITQSPGLKTNSE